LKPFLRITASTIHVVVEVGEIAQLKGRRSRTRVWSVGRQRRVRDLRGCAHASREGELKSLQIPKRRAVGACFRFGSAGTRGAFGGSPTHAAEDEDEDGDEEDED
jgi:hypothetical protein